MNVAAIFPQLSVVTRMLNLAPQNTPKHVISRSKNSIFFYGEAALKRGSREGAALPSPYSP